ncbi:MAG TPA: AAA family ATPase [Clostridiales bacterium]|nr:AAA family ATPase [Clostridiales bacterium]
MYLSLMELKNFRCFDDTSHIVTFNPGLTVLVGENDSGKSAIMDAIRLVLGTTDFSWYRIESSDFYKEDMTLEINIICKFWDLSKDEQAAFLECLTYESNDGIQKPCLYLHWRCKYLTSFKPPRTVSSISTGKDGNGPSPAAEARELLRITYLRALRDAYNDMQSGRYSRLSQIIQNIPLLNVGKSEYEDGMNLDELSLVGITNLSNQLLAEYSALRTVNQNMTDILTQQMLLKGDTLKTRLEVAGSNNSDTQKLMSLLEKLDLAIDKDVSSMKGKAGLGTSNIMSMACELLLHKESEEAKRSSFLLIEEPEAHVHAQRQLKLIQSLEHEAEEKRQQIILTTHSPLLASVVKLSNIVIVKDGNVYPLSKNYTELEEDDYLFLEKYLDATKANLFFARSVIIVEGPGEALLMPTLAKLLGFSFTDYGASLVDVRSTGLRRYARIFQRKDSKELLRINVACVTDRDVMPDCAPGICIDKKYTTDKKTWPEEKDRNWKAEADFSTPQEVSEHIKKICERADGQQVKTYIADRWTLEYDLAYAGFRDSIMSNALLEALVKVTYVKANQESKKLEISKIINDYKEMEEKASYFYSFFSKNRTSKADFAQQLAFELENTYKGKAEDLKKVTPGYLVDAIEYIAKG